jgi:hypothetical protein
MSKNIILVLVVVSFDVKKPTFCSRKEEEMGKSEREIFHFSFYDKKEEFVHKRVCAWVGWGGGGGNEAHMGAMKNMYKVLEGKPE